MTETLAVLAGILGIILWWLKSRHKESPKVRYAKRIISRARSNVSKMRWSLQNRDLGDLEDAINRQESDLDALRSLHEKSDQADK